MPKQRIVLIKKDSKILLDQIQVVKSVVNKCNRKCIYFCDYLNLEHVLLLMYLLFLYNRQNV